MSFRASTLGRCPRCDASIPRSRLLIEYERSDGRATYAECPNCRDVVHPAPANARRGDGRSDR